MHRARRWHLNSNLKAEETEEDLGKSMAFLHNVVKQHSIKRRELICPRAYRNYNNLL